MASIYSIPVTTAKGEVRQVGDFIQGKVALIVNTASACGFTPQLEGLQALQEKLGPRGFTVLAYPCNQFGQQEPGDNETIAKFCSTRFKATFPIMNKTDVNGPNADPLWVHLKSQKGGFLGFDGMCVCARWAQQRRGCPASLSRHSPPLFPRRPGQQVELHQVSRARRQGDRALCADHHARRDRERHPRAAQVKAAARRRTALPCYRRTNRFHKFFATTHNTENTILPPRPHSAASAVIHLQGIGKREG